MSTPVRWVVGIAAVVLVVCLLTLARGQEHHRGNQVGSTPALSPVVLTS